MLNENHVVFQKEVPLHISELAIFFISLLGKSVLWPDRYDFTFLIIKQCFQAQDCSLSILIREQSQSQSDRG